MRIGPVAVVAPLAADRAKRFCPGSVGAALAAARAVAADSRKAHPSRGQNSLTDFGVPG